jgi:3-mercaptopyruvate sulfurtransferase SseA
MGVYRVRPLRGGFDGWKQAGYPLVDYVTDTPTTAVVQQILPADTGSAIPLV